VLDVDTTTSYRSTNAEPKPYKIEGLGVDYVSPLMAMSAIDDFLLCSDDDAMAMLKELARKQGLLVEPAAAATAYAAREYAKTLTPEDMIVILITDSGRSYLTKGYYN